MAWHVWRVGRNNVIFKMPKFRSMQLGTPEVATHLLADARSYLTPIGSFLRKSSLDELPQLWSILVGDMSFVGPRPALFSQQDLIVLRTEQGVHTLVPGLTGWAQVNGRDELPIPEKVKLDVGYLHRQTLEQFDFERLPQLNRALVHDLATGRYVRECSPVLIVGPSGTGKSHLAQALGHCAVRQGTDVLLTSCAALTHTLNAARATNAYERKLQTLSRIPVLIIDDFGLKPLRTPADEDLHELIAERYERTATIITSNLDFTEWDQAFPSNPLLASATLDRLRHNAYCLTLDGQSYRTPRQVATTTATKTKNSASQKDAK